MTDPQGYTVTVSALNSDATLWDAQADRMNTIVGQVAGLRIDHTQGGLFQMIVNAYAEVCDAIADRSKEGHGAMIGIATGLRATASNYHQQDQQTADSINAINGQKATP